MEPTTKKILRSLLYTIAMGVVSLVVVVETQNQGYLNLLMGVSYILGALMVFGVDINRIKAGPLVIHFESDRPERALDEFDE